MAGVQHLLSRTWAEDLGLSVLLADFSSALEDDSAQPVPQAARVHTVPAANLSCAGAFLESARGRYGVVAASLPRSAVSKSLDVLQRADAILLVAESSPASLAIARDLTLSLRPHGLHESCGLLLIPVPGGLRPGLAEDFTNVPVCSLIESTRQIKRLAAFLAFDRDCAA